MLKMFSDEQKFIEGYDYFCIRNCIKQVLEYYNILNAEFYIDTTLGIEMNIVDFPKIIINYDIEPITVLSPYFNNIKIFTPEKEPLSDVWTDMKKIINKGLPVIAYVDVFYLKHTSYYKVMHGIHTVIVCGYSSDENTIYVIDYTKPWFFKGEISREDFEAARMYDINKDIYGSTKFPPRKKWIYIERNGWNANPQELLYKTITSIENKFFRPCYDKSDNSFYGIHVINKIYEIVKVLQTENINVKESFFKPLCNQMFLMVRYEMFFLQYIENYLHTFSTRNYDYELNVLREGVSLWRKLLTLIMKTSMTFSDTVYERMVSFFKHIIEQEEKRYIIIRNIKNNIDFR